MGVSTKMANYSAVALTMSPGHARLNELTSRMQAVHDDFEAEKKARSSVMELKCRAIDEKIMRNKRSEDERLKPIYILIERLGLDIGSERDHLSYLDVKLNEDVKELEKAMQDEIEDQRKQRSDLEKKITKQIDQACINLREDFAREKERRDESQKRREKKVADEILRITESLDIERKNRLSGENGIYTKMNEKLRDVENALLDERKGRVELETVFSEALEERPSLFSSRWPRRRRSARRTLRTPTPASRMPWTVLTASCRLSRSSVRPMRRL